MLTTSYKLYNFKNNIEEGKSMWRFCIFQREYVIHECVQNDYSFKLKFTILLLDNFIKICNFHENSNKIQ